MVLYCFLSFKSRITNKHKENYSKSEMQKHIIKYKYVISICFDRENQRSILDWNFFLNSLHILANTNNAVMIQLRWRQ